MALSDGFRRPTSAPGLCSGFDDPDVLCAIYAQLWANLLKFLQHGLAGANEISTSLDLRSATAEEAEEEKKHCRDPERYVFPNKKKKINKMSQA